MVQSGNILANSFYGHYEVSVTDDCRLTLPSKVRKQFLATNADQIWLSKHPVDPALILCTDDQWTELKNKIKTNHGDAAERLFIAPSQPIAWDKKGRIYLPAELCRYAKISAEIIVVIVGVEDGFEIWAEESFKSLG